MELYDLMKNIRGKNNEEELKNAINIVKITLDSLTKERMCKVYSSFLLEELRNKHIPARIINTLDLGLNYEHEFVMILNNTFVGEYYVADLTFSQFNKEDELFKKLLIDGYQSMNDNTFLNFLNIIEKGELSNKISIENAFYSSEINNQKKR